MSGEIRVATIAGMGLTARLSRGVVEFSNGRGDQVAAVSVSAIGTAGRFLELVPGRADLELGPVDLALVKAMLREAVHPPRLAEMSTEHLHVPTQSGSFAHVG